MPIKYEPAEIFPEDYPMLKQKIEPFVFGPIEDLSLPARELVVGRLWAAMFDETGKQRAVGLAANQCAIPFRVFVMQNRHSCWNPEIVNHSEETNVKDEGCMSFPGLRVRVKRWREIEVKYQNIDGDFVSETLREMDARIFQHELDHLDGITILDRANKYHRDLALKKRKHHGSKR